MSLNVDLPYCAEYAKTGRAGCKRCKTNIEKDSLRLAVMVHSPYFDGKQPNWHHYDCFFQRYHPKNIGEIKNFEHLKYEDQQKLKKSLECGQSESKSGQKINDKRKRKVVDEAARDFSVEYDKSGRASCKLCKNKIGKGEVRIGKLDQESEEALRIGPFNRWFHVECFRSSRDDLGFQWSADVMNNFESLDKVDQKSLRKKIPANENNIAKQPKIEKYESNKEEKALKKQSDLIFKYIEELKKLRKPQIISIFEHNQMENLPKNDRRIEFLADALAFGLPEKCPLCGGCLNFKVSQYVCSGNTDEWSRCSYVVENPKRVPLKIPCNLMKNCQFLKDYKFKPRQRVINQNLKASFQSKVLQQQMQEMVVKKEEENEIENDGHTKPILNGYTLTYLGIKMDEKKIEHLGGKYTKDIDHNVLCLLSDADYLKKSKSKKISIVKDLKIPVVSEKFLTSLSTPGVSLKKALIESKISFWDQTEREIEKRLENLNSISTIKSGSGKSKSISQKIIVKDGTVVDPDSDLQDRTHIYKEGNDIYSAVLNLVDVNANKNSYYKIQLLQDDSNGNNFWLFKSWGRIGTEIGNNKLEKFYDKANALKAFQDTYFERTKNEWKYRDNFVKHPFSYYPVEIDYGDCNDLQTINVDESKSLLPVPVRELISLIFNVNNMKKAMLEFELDLEKMPLGKLSKNRILEACATLKEISSLLDTDPLPRNQLISACNKFYSLVPHNFGLSRPPLILSQDVIAKKNEMLESLIEIELAYEIIKDNKDSKENVIDLNYKKLKADIQPMDPNDADFELIQKYIQNTHAKTHDIYTLEIINVFRVTREGEMERFTEFADNPNRMLLWHGSRLTNFVGILSQGLRIAPKEAPMTGYMFGKGVYFADSVSKSANYCYTSYDTNIGLLVLSEVAVGNSMELTESKYITKLKKKYQSVKGIGSSHPDPSETIITSDGIQVPIGKLIKNNNVKNTSLLYNEYIVYNEKQIKIKYLVQVRFNYKSLF